MERAASDPPVGTTPAVHPAAALAEAGRLASAVIRSLPDAAIVVTDADLVVRHAVGSALPRLGWVPEAVVGRHLADVMPADLFMLHGPLYRSALQGDAARIETLAPDGVTALRTDVEPLTAEDGTPIGALTVIRDISGSHAAEQAAQQRFRLAFDNAPIGMALVGLDGRWMRANRALCGILGYAQDELFRLTWQDLTHPDDLDADLALLKRTLAGELPGYQLEKRYITSSGTLIWAQLSVSLVRDESGHPDHLISQIQDISERKRMEERLVRLADHDPLTGLWNRRRFEEEVQRQVARCARNGERAALLLFDLDHFKYVNDTLGHKVGDDLIGHVARSVRARLRATDSIARLGGDEFAVLLSGADQDAALAVAEEICAVVRESPSEIGDEEVHTTASIGVAALTTDIASAQDAFIAADLAMYDAKAAGRNRAHLYVASDEQHRRLSEGLVWSQKLRQAIDRDQLVLHAQPVLDAETREVVHYELLLRMVEEDGSLVLPSEFLYTAERFGVMRQIDHWVIEHATVLAAEHPDATLAINLSGKSVADVSLPEFIETAISDAGCDPRRLIFEITEHEAIANMDQARRLSERLGVLGCRVALDDFGAGFSGFAYLKNLPVDQVKIDGEFVRELVRNETDQLFVRALQTIPAGMGKQTVAEFVEDEAIAVLLGELGVDLLQGFHTGAPLPVDEALGRS